jgi:anti-anti-sigma regulatory factor
MIVLDEDIGIKKIISFYNSLKREMEDEDEIIIDFSKVARIDLSVAQVVTAAGRSAKKLGKTIRLKSVGNTVKRQMQLCGLKV